MAGGKLSITVDVKVGENQLDALQESMASRFKDIDISFDDSAIKTLTNKIEGLGNDPIEIKLDSTKAIGELEQIETKFKSLKDTMEAFTLSGAAATKGNLGKGFMSDINDMSSGLKKGMSSAEIDIKTITNNIQQSMKGLRSIGQADAMLSGLKESEVAVRSVTSATQKAASQAKEFASQQSSAYKELETSVKSYYQALERMDKFQDRVDKNVATKSDISNLAAAKKQVEQLGSAMDKLETSFKAGDNQKFFDADLDKGVRNLKQMSQEARELQQNINSAGNEAKQLESAYDELVKIQKQINQLNKQEANAGDEESAVIREQIGLLEQKSNRIREINNLNQRSNAQREDEISDLKQMGNLERRRADSKITDRANRPSSTRRGQGYESVFGMDRIYGYIDVLDVMREGAQVVRKQFEEFRELDNALVDIRKVADATDNQWARFNDTLYDNASAVGKTATEYSKSVERWAAAGFDLQEATELGTLSTMGAFVGNINEEAMVKYMSVPLNAFKASVDATDILNVMNEVSNNTAAEMNHLGEAYSRAAATAAQSGTSFEELTAILATAQEATRLGGEVIGTTWRTMDKNVSQIASQTTAGQKKNYEMFKDWGVDLLDANGELKSTYDVLQDISKVWNNLSSVEQTTAATAIGGARGLAMIQSLMANWGRVDEILGMAQGQLGLGDTGSAFEEFEIQKDSMEFKIAELKNTWQEFMNSLMGGDAAGVFKGALEEMTGFVETLQAIAENESAVNVIKTLAEGLGVILAMDFASSGIQKLFGEKGLLGGGALKSITSGFKEASKGAKGLGGVMKGLGGAITGGGWAAAPGKLMLVYAAFKAIDFAIESITGKDIGSHLKLMFNPVDDLTKATDKYSKSVENMNETFAKNDAIREQINDYRDFANSIEEAEAAGRRAYAQSGDVADLGVSPEEIRRITDEHNNMVEELGLPVDLKIRFHNFDHIMQQIGLVKAELAEIEAQTMRDDISVASSAFTDRRNVLSEVEDHTQDIKDSRMEIRAYERDIQKLRDAGWKDEYPLDPSHVEEYGLEVMGAYETIETAYGHIDRLNKEITSAEQNLEEVLDPEKWKANEEAVQKATDKMSDYIDQVLSGDNAAETFMDIFGADTKEAQQAGIFSFLMGANEQIADLEWMMNNFNETKSEFGDWSDLTTVSDTGIAELKQEIDGAVSSSQEFKDVLNSTDYSTFDELLGAAIEGVPAAQEAINKIVNEVVPNYYEEQIAALEQSKSELLTLAGEAGFDSQQIAQLEQASKAGASMGDMVRTMMSLNAGAATAVLGIDPDAYADAILRFGDNASTVFGQITDSVYELQGLDTVRFNELVDSDGIVDYGKILTDLGQITNDDFMVQLGVTGKDGAIEDIGAFYDFTDTLKGARGKELEELATLEVSTELVSGDLPNFDAILEAINNEELEVEVNTVLNEDGIEEIESFTLTDMEGKSVDLEFKPDVDTTAMGEQIRKGAEGAEAEVEIKVTPALRQDGTGIDYDDWIRGIDLEGTGYEVPISLQTDLSTADAESQIQSLVDTADVETIIDIMAQANLEIEFDEDGNIDLDSFTDQIQGMLNSGGEQATVALEVLAELGFIKKEGLSEEAQSLIDGEGPIEGEMGANIELDPELDGDPVGDMSEQLEDQFTTGGVGPIQAEVPIDIALSENIIQDNLDGITSILSDDYGIEVGIDVQSDGIEPVVSALSELPEEEQILIMAKAMGIENLDNISNAIDGIPSEKIVNAILQATGTDTLEAGIAALENFDGTVATAEATTINNEEGDKPEPPTDAEATHTTYVEFAVTNPEAVAALDGQDISFTVTANINDNASAGIQSINSALESIPLTQSVSVTASTFGAMSQIALVRASLTMLGMMVVTPKINGDNSGFFTAAGEVSGWVPPSFEVRIGANTQPFRSAVAGLSALVPSSLSTTINAKVSRSGSATIGADIGSSFSNSIGSALGSGSLYSQQINRSQSTTEEAKVSEDVWRYWAKEMYDGDKLADSMDELTAAISRAGDDYAKIINLSRQQIALAKDQMRFEREMVGLEQQQMNSILSELRGYGFKTDGNKVTNLDYAKNLSGDTATDAEKALNTWRELYKSITGLNGRINDLQGTIHGAEEAVEDARLNLELERLEKRLAKTELLLSSISNNLSILNDKDSFIGSEDYELKIRVSEENIDTSISNIRTLMDEFNRLAVTSLEFEENSEVLLGTLEDLADDILENADNILQFREQITQIRIDSLTDDFDRFSDAVDRNTESVSRNVDLLREGLMDAYGTDELGGAYTVDYTRKTALEREYEDRLRLAERLDTALENFTKKNIQRTHSATQAQLQIAKSGYNELLKIQQGMHSAGIGSLSSYMDVGVTSVSGGGSKFAHRQLELLQHLEQYQAAYNDQIRKYEQALRSAATTRDREIAQYDMIIAQLALQEEYQNKAIENYKSAISLAEAEIANGNITTEQRRDLLEFIDDYRDKITDAQDVIREAIGARFEYEFDLMDKAADKAESYYDNISHLLDVGKMINLSPDAMKPFFDAVYKASSYQYALAEEQLRQLNAQQKEFTQGSYEWNLLAEQIDNVRESMKDLTIQSLESNQAILENTMDSLERMFEIGLLGGKTLSQWKDFNDEWVNGIEKEVTLEGLRRKALDAESQVIKDRLNMLDKQEDVSKSDLDYLDKQLKILELEGKLRNLENERNVQVLGRRADGTWGFDYVADQTEYDKTRDELDEANVDLEKFITEQRTEYVERLGGIIDTAREGGYSDTSEMQSDLDLLNSIYGMVLSDIPGFTGMSFDEILSAYQQYLANNDIITDGLVGSGVGSIDNTVIGTGLTPVQQELVGITTQLGEIIGSELRRALGDVNSDGFKGAQIYQIGELVLPNVTDGDGLVNIFNDLPKAAEQAIYDKSN